MTAIKRERAKTKTLDLKNLVEVTKNIQLIWTQNAFPRTPLGKTELSFHFRDIRLCDVNNSPVNEASGGFSQSKYHPKVL